MGASSHVAAALAEDEPLNRPGRHAPAPASLSFSATRNERVECADRGGRNITDIPHLVELDGRADA